MSKRDRQGVRTPAGLERKYNFEKRFDNAMDAVENLDSRLNQTEVFNRLTNNGKSQGVYMGNDGNLYINASYLVTGILKSQDGSTFYLDLVNGILKGQFTELSISGKSVEQTAQDTVDSQSQEDIYNKLTNNGEARGIFYRNGELYINASYIVGSAPIGILQSVYPVGAIYISTIETNPTDLFGFGTWEQIKDTFLLAAGDTYTAGATGGEATHTLTIDEMPSHSHNFTGTGAFEGWNFNSINKVGSAYSAYPALYQGADYSSSGYLLIGNTGDSQPHNNMPPYLAVYVWKRTA